MKKQNYKPVKIYANKTGNVSSKYKFGFNCSLWVTVGNCKGKYEYIAWTNIQNLFGAWEKQRKGLNNEKDHWLREWPVYRVRHLNYQTWDY